LERAHCSMEPPEGLGGWAGGSAGALAQPSPTPALHSQEILPPSSCKRLCMYSLQPLKHVCSGPGDTRQSRRLCKVQGRKQVTGESEPLPSPNSHLTASETPRQLTGVSSGTTSFRETSRCFLNEKT
jgi:hypothetical protein